MSDHVIVWDLETVPDLQAVARANGLAEHDGDAAAEALGEKFPKLPFHQIVCIGAVVAERAEDHWDVTAIGAPHTGERTERQLISAFAEKIAALRPCLISYNGHGFDLPVLRYRAMMHRISAPGLDARSYFNRYSTDSVDLCDVLSSFDGRSRMKLNDLCRALNLPGKPDEIDGSRVAEYYAAGRIVEIANYCECDVVSTYRLWLLYELFRGSLTKDQYEQSERQLGAYVAGRLVEKPHWERLIESRAVEPAGVPIIVQT